MLKFLFLLFPIICFSYTKSDHFDGERFFNPQGDDLKSFWDVMKWKMTSTPEEWPKHVANKHYPLKFLISSEKMNATFINHSTFFIQFPGVNLLTDPVFSERVSPVSFAGPKRVRSPGISFDELPPIDVVIISHNHYDHLDLTSLVMIDKKFHPLFIVPIGDEKLLLKAGIQNVKALDWWEEIRVKDVRFIFTPSQHWSARSFWDKNECLWGSYMIDSGNYKIYFAGDTGHGKHFLETTRRLGPPDLALLPIGAYRPRWFMKYYHLDPEEAVLAHIELKAKRSIAMHFGTFQMSDEAIDEPVRDLKRALEKLKISEEEFLILQEGQGVAD